MIIIHVYSWITALVLFAVSFFLLVSRNEKPQKMTHMILRLAYLGILTTGFHLLGVYQFMTIVVMKSLLGIFVIGLMEMSLSRGKKGKPVKLLIILLVIAVTLTLYMGYHVI